MRQNIYNKTPQLFGNMGNTDKEAPSWVPKK